VVTEPEYPDGLPLFTYRTPERVVTVCLTYPEDGSAPPPLSALRDEVQRELRRRQDEGEPADPFLVQWLDALEKLLARKASGCHGEC
jgi:hypothetical protein